MKKQVPSKSYGWLVTMMLAGGALAYVLLVFLPGQVKLSMLRSELRDQQQFVIQADRLISVIQQTQDELAETRKYAEQWQQRAPEEADLPALYGQITDAARQCGVAVLRFEPQPAVRLDSVSQISTTLVGQGEFAELFQFLQRLENLPAASWVSQLQLRENAETGKELQCTLTLTIFANNHGISG